MSRFLTLHSSPHVIPQPSQNTICYLLIILVKIIRQEVENITNKSFCNCFGKKISPKTSKSVFSTQNKIFLLFTFVVETRRQKVDNTNNKFFWNFLGTTCCEIFHKTFWKKSFSHNRTIFSQKFQNKMLLKIHRQQSLNINGNKHLICREVGDKAQNNWYIYEVLSELLIGLKYTFWYTMYQ